MGTFRRIEEFLKEKKLSYANLFFIYCLISYILKLSLFFTITLPMEASISLLPHLQLSKYLGTLFILVLHTVHS